jgi:hypothetical protein
LINEIRGRAAALFGEQLTGWLGLLDEWLCGRAIMRFASAQQDGKKAAFSICDCVYFRIASAARASNRLVLLSPFPPDAEWCALMWVESIICV